MTDIKARSLSYGADQEHVLRRIGAALIIHWDELPDALQDRVIDQAMCVQDADHPAEPRREDVEAFIRNAKVRDCRPGFAPRTPPTAPGS